MGAQRALERLELKHAIDPLKLEPDVNALSLEVHILPPEPDDFSHR